MESASWFGSGKSCKSIVIHVIKTKSARASLRLP